MKPSLLNAPQVSLIKSLMPETKLMMITRHVEPTLESNQKILQLVQHCLPSEQGDFWMLYLPLPYEDPHLKEVAISSTLIIPIETYNVSSHGRKIAQPFAINFVTHTANANNFTNLCCETG